MAGSLIPKEMIISGSLICEINNNYIVYADEDKFITLYFIKDIKDICFDTFSRIQYRFIFKKILVYDDVIVSIDNDSTKYLDTEYTLDKNYINDVYKNSNYPNTYHL